MNKELLQKYAEAKQREKAAKEDIELMKAAVIKEIQLSEVDKIESDFGTFSLEAKKTWEYSSEIQTAIKTLKRMQVTEKADGTADFTEVPMLKYYAKA